MVGALTSLPPVSVLGHKASGLGSEDHPMRIMTRRAAGLLPDPWDAEARGAVAAYFDGLAGDWHTRTSPARNAVVLDALDRGLPELGSGRRVRRAGERHRGLHTDPRAPAGRRVLAVEVALEMLLRAPAEPGHRILADGARLPLADGAASAVVLVNCFLFPAEVDRVLGPEGVVVWVNSSGAQTPIHLPAEDVAAAPARAPGRACRAALGRACGASCTARSPEDCQRAAVTESARPTWG